MNTAVEIEKFIKERDAMLLKCSVSELRNFVNLNAECFNPLLVDGVNRATDGFLEEMLHNMILADRNLPFDFRRKSYLWLKDKGVLYK